MTDKYQRLRDALAAGPTPGPWKAVTGPGYDYGSTNYGVSAPPPHYWVVPTLNIPEVNTEYIAAADPDTIRALLDERDQLQKLLTVARKYVEDEVVHLRNALKSSSE